MRDNYSAAQIITQTDDPHLFVWGTNPMLYALTQKAPVGRFTVAFHIRDFSAYQETMDAVLDKKPMFIVTMNNEPQLDGLNELLDNEYIVNENFEYFNLWKKR
jgi:hypothetical protein